MPTEAVQSPASGRAATAAAIAPLPRFWTLGNCDPVSWHAFGRQALLQVNEEFRN
jgi:hypothetical protein